VNELRLPDSAGRTWVPTLLLAVCTVGVVLVRPALPVDEMRYLEILREHLSGNLFLLHLRGEAYAEKPPLLFWLARTLCALGFSPQVALRLIPALAATLTVPLVARVGRRAGLELAGWMQAALLLPFLMGQFLFFDSLLSCAVWAAVDAWTRGRDGQATLAASLALLAKGPVAFLFLGPLLWALAPLRPAAPSLRRAATVLSLALIPLALWAVAAAVAGGPAFARSLLWERWAGRLVRTFAHDRPFYFYVPVVLVGALPATPLFFRRNAAEAEVWTRRLLCALVGILLAFTLISGKQAHYLVPAAPGLALWAAWKVKRSPGGARGLRQGARAVLLLLAVAAILGMVFGGELRGAAGASGRAYLDGGGPRLLLSAALVLSVLGAAATRRATSPATLLAIVLGCAGATSLVAHRVAGRLLYPRALERALDVDPRTPVARLASSQHGLLALFARRDRLDVLRDTDELLRWAAAHPGGRIVDDRGVFPETLTRGLTLVASDVAHNNPLLVVLVSADPGAFGRARTDAGATGER